MLIENHPGTKVVAMASTRSEALDILERFFGRGWGKRDWVEHDPDYDCVREHPRFKAVFKNLK